MYYYEFADIVKSEFLIPPEPLQITSQLLHKNVV